jgi:hypothetical protein
MPGIVRKQACLRNREPVAIPAIPVVPASEPGPKTPGVCGYARSSNSIIKIDKSRGMDPGASCAIAHLAGTTLMEELP